MRLFIAVEVPEGIKRILKSVQEKLKLDGRMTKTKEFHLTLKFLGEVPEQKLDDIKQSLGKISFDPFKARLSDIGAFPTKNNPRVVWAGLEPHQTINALQQQVDDTMTNIGFEKDNRFHPHLTLSRIKFCNNRKEFADLLDNIRIEQAEFDIKEFKLIKSTLTPQGPVYDVLALFNK
jgi:2'-5' RNA ligase